MLCQPVEAQPQAEPRVSTSSDVAEASYENVEAIQHSQSSSTQEELGSKMHQQVNTIYSILQAPKATPPLGQSGSSNDMKGPQKIREASTSQCVTSGDTEQQIDTVYSVLQKPETLQSQRHQ